MGNFLVHNLASNSKKPKLLSACFMNFWCNSSSAFELQIYIDVWTGYTFILRILIFLKYGAILRREDVYLRAHILKSLWRLITQTERSAERLGKKIAAMKENILPRVFDRPAFQKNRFSPESGFRERIKKIGRFISAIRFRDYSLR